MFVIGASFVYFRDDFVVFLSFFLNFVFETRPSHMSQAVFELSVLSPSSSNEIWPVYIVA